ncbi:AEC family transporter [Propionibacterium cyclohexanicum]|uniref:AEC family transporter n=1 Tax=Propionibacterium cyclohexanicum TaxID=64702 RepID=UPI000B89F8FE|nr:AEC family transporter [Propionibacterium cyclohexanicum]
MFDVLSGFVTIWVVIGVGVLVARLGVLDESAEKVLNRLAFAVGMPSLMFVTLSRANASRIFSTNVLVGLIAVGVSILAYLLASYLRPRASTGHRVIGAFCACYVNANNMGIPISAYVMKDTSWVAPLLLMQQGLMQPIGLSILDLLETRRAGRASSWLRNMTTPLRNPMTLGVLLGLVFNLAHLPVPRLVGDSLDLLGGLAVPCMLIAYGISLRNGLHFHLDEGAETLYLCVLKLFVQPLAALAFAWLLGLDQATALAAVVLAALPTAQNVFVFSSRYGIAQRLCRDVILITTLCSIVTIAGFVALVHLIW